MALTMSEQLFTRKTGSRVQAGDIVVADVDLIVSHDGNRPQATDLFREMNGKQLAKPDRVKLVIDHAPSTPDRVAAEVHRDMKVFAEEFGAESIGSGEGICHQVVPERGFVTAGDLVVGTDSHTCTYGAFNSFGTGVGSSDLAAAMLTGQLWFRVPESILVDLQGELSPGVTSKDIVLALCGKLTANGATYMALEFTGSAIGTLSVGARMTVSNMAIEMGAKAGLMPFDSTLAGWLENRSQSAPNPLVADADARYAERLMLDVEKLSPQVAVPHAVDNVHTIDDVLGTTIDEAVIGTCTNGRLEDLAIAAEVLRGRRVSPHVRFLVTPASRTVYLQAIRAGIAETLLQAGAVFQVPGCSGCTGGSRCGVPAAGERVITTANRNFKGRLGNPESFLYLASPATVAASALEGRIADPRKYVENRNVA